VRLRPAPAGAGLELLATGAVRGAGWRRLLRTGLLAPAAPRPARPCTVEPRGALRRRPFDRRAGARLADRRHRRALPAVGPHAAARPDRGRRRSARDPRPARAARPVRRAEAAATGDRPQPLAAPRPGSAAAAAGQPGAMGDGLPGLARARRLRGR